MVSNLQETMVFLNKIIKTNKRNANPSYTAWKKLNHLTFDSELSQSKYKVFHKYEDTQHRLTQRTEDERSRGI